MLDALASGDVDRFSDLLEERGRQVRAAALDLEGTGFSPGEAEALSAQSARLEKAMQSTRAGIGAAISAVSRFQVARASYDEKPGVMEGILNKSLHG